MRGGQRTGRMRNCGRDDARHPLAELDALNVSTLGAAAEARGLQWLHLPIEDVQTPTAEWMAAWRQASPGFRAILQNHGRILVHCKGGLGRAGV